MLVIAGYFFGGIALTCALSLLYYQARTGVPPMPANRREKTAAARFLKELDLPQNAVVCELGCGWGTLIHQLQGSCPELCYRGYEISVLPYLVSKLWFWRQENVMIYRQDFFKSSLEDADVLVCYLMRAPMKALERHIVDRCLPARGHRRLTLIALGFWLEGCDPMMATDFAPGVAVYQFGGES